MLVVELVIRFKGALWEYQGEAPWVFVTLPVEDADEILDKVPEPGGFGSVKVDVSIGESRWQTSVFPDKASGSFVLPVKKAIRDREVLSPGDSADIELRIEID